MKAHNVAGHRSLGWLIAGFLGWGSSCLAWAQAPSLDGYYEIVSGSYGTCCGFAGIPLSTPLPTEHQNYVRLERDPANGMVRMTFLGQDLQTVAGESPCPSAPPVAFDLPFGFVSASGIEFHVDPGPPPLGLTWAYTVALGEDHLIINGALSLVQVPCPDTPSQFTHRDVVAVRLPGPRLTLLDPAPDQSPRIMVQGRAGWTDVIEASGDLSTWTAVSTNVMDFSLCPICPYAVVEDAAGAKLARRYYRAREYR